MGVIHYHGHLLNVLVIEPFICKNINSFSPVYAIAYQVTWTNGKSLDIHLVTLPNAINRSDRLQLRSQANLDYHLGFADRITSWQLDLGWVGLWAFMWWAPSVKRKDHHGISFGWNSTWFHPNTDLSCTQYEQIPIMFGVCLLWLTPFFFRSITFWWVYG